MASNPMRWQLRLVCCGYEAGDVKFSTWDEADRFRESYCTGPGVEANGHERVGIIQEEPTDG